jgi:hypothetical protein
MLTTTNSHISYTDLFYCSNDLIWPVAIVAMRYQWVKDDVNYVRRYYTFKRRLTEESHVPHWNGSMASKESKQLRWWRRSGVHGNVEATTAIRRLKWRRWQRQLLLIGRGGLFQGGIRPARPPRFDDGDTTNTGERDLFVGRSRQIYLLNRRT